MSKKQFRQVIILPNFVVIDIVAVEICAAQKMKFTEEILNEKLHFLCSNDGFSFSRGPARTCDKRVE